LHLGTKKKDALAALSGTTKEEGENELLAGVFFCPSSTRGPALEKGKERKKNALRKEKKNSRLSP